MHQIVEGAPRRVTAVQVEHVRVAVLPLPLNVIVVREEQVEAESAVLVEVDGLR